MSENQENEILNDSEKEVVQTEPRRRVRRTGRSMFGPLMLITIGVYFLMANLGVLPDLNWGAALRLWPLLLVFAGLNIIVRQVPRPGGTWLSLLVSLVTIGVFSYALLFARPVEFLGNIELFGEVTVKREAIAFPADDVRSADIYLNTGAPNAEISALVDSPNLIDGEVTYVDELAFETSVSDGRANVSLETADSRNWWVWLNPANWSIDGEDNEWFIGLNSRLPIDLVLDVGSGSVDLELDELTLEALEIDGGSGSATVTLPGGDYDATYDIGSGSVVMTLPADGRHDINIMGGSGSLTLNLPDTMEMEFSAESGSGGLSVLNDRLDRGGTRSGDEVWATAGYEDAPNRVTLFVDIGSGSVTVR